MALQDWLKEKDCGTLVKKEVSWKDPASGELVTKVLEIEIINGVQKTAIEQELFSKDRQSSMIKFKRALVGASLRLPQTDLDELYRIKSGPCMEAIEDICLKVNASKYYISPEEIDELKNSEKREP